MSTSDESKPNLLTWAWLCFAIYILIRLLSQKLGIDFWIVLIVAGLIALIGILAYFASVGRNIRLRENLSKSPQESTVNHLEEYENLEQIPEQSYEEIFGLALTGLMSLVVATSTLTGFAVFAYQSFMYLRSGIWTSISLIDGFSALNSNSWLLDPKDWLGLHSLLDQVPLSVALMAVGLLFIFRDDW